MSVRLGRLLSWRVKIEFLLVLIESSWTSCQTTSCRLHWLSVQILARWRGASHVTCLSLCRSTSSTSLPLIVLVQSFSSFNYNSICWNMSLSNSSLIGLWDFLVVHDGLTDLLERHSWFEHMNQQCSLVVLLILRNVILELEVSTSHSDHQFVTGHLNDLLLTSNKEALLLNVNDWNSKV